jgi:HEAT repeat protein
VKVLGETKTLMAVGELIAALDDPSIEVRRQAAQSLGQIGDPKAVPALIQKLRDDSAHINTEAAEALGQIGHSDATSALLEQLQHPDPAVRLAVTDALSKVSSHHQVEPSIDSAQLTQSVEEIQDLPVDEIIQLLLAPEVFVRANAAEALRCLNSHKAVQALRQSLAKEEDVQALSAMAYALGWLGDPDDAKLLLNLLIQSDASLVRKRIALGIAHLWGVEKELYSYFSYDGMHRDNAVMKSLQPLSKRHPHLPIALEAYAGGRYNEFIHEISSCFLDYAPLQLLAKYGHTESADHELSLLAVVILESKG